MTETAALCPCGSQAQYSDCCEPFIAKTKTPDTAEQLMRSRYSAYVKGALKYLYDTTHPSGRGSYDHDGTKEWAENSDWQGLEIVSVRGGTPTDGLGEVEFKARYNGDGVERIHHELGRFRKHDGEWYFTDGKMVGQMPIKSDKVGRNDSCPCGSGKKYKKCCGA